MNAVPGDTSSLGRSNRLHSSACKRGAGGQHAVERLGGPLEEVTFGDRKPSFCWRQNQASVTEGVKLEGCRGDRKASWKTQTGLVWVQGFWNFLPSLVASHETGRGVGHDRIGRRRDDGVSCGKGLGQGLRSWQTGGKGVLSEGPR